EFVEHTGIPVCETQGGKSSLPDDDALNMGAVGVTGTEASNRLAEEADVVVAVGTRLQDFTTGSWALFRDEGKTIIGLNVQPFDAAKHRALPLVVDAREGLKELQQAVGAYKAPGAWTRNAMDGKSDWQAEAAKATGPTNVALPSDAQVIGAVQRAMGPEIVALHAAGGLPGEMHKLWQAGGPGSYHAEYGFSCMGYEIAGALGVKLARPDTEVVVMIGDGSYLMLNSEIATSVMMGLKLTIVLLDNRGFGCINRLQMATGGANFNNLLRDSWQVVTPEVDFVAHAHSMGAAAEKVSSIAELETALERSKDNDRTTLILIDTDPLISTDAGGHWWDVAVPEVSVRHEVREARENYERQRAMQRVGD
ncbi:3D-(3,5/4)-trihydroxycyclohexane-1,2-dione acylhydrolase (decyclizing), partial [Salmonella enterica subsp. enterica serovar Enteritidis]|nr:3D-(3,5/4)-trihydroxycyclohexane-1,2-dione acylhydrolase (decyclizing) [Salmonella enterica subsp. enterica serovar Enteritidis]